MASYIEVAEFIGVYTNDRNEAKKAVENHAAENGTTTKELFQYYEELAANARWERKLEGYYDY
jgi:hypothetical protein